MQQWFENLGWKKVAAILVVVSIVFFGVIIFSMRGYQKRSPGSLNNIPTPTTFQGSGNNSQNGNSGGNVQVYQDETIEISYPDEFLASEGLINGRDKSILLRNAIDQKIEIQIYNASEIPVSRIRGVFKGLGFVETSNQIAGQNGYFFLGSVGSLQERAAVFEKNGKVYKIQLIYTSQGRDPRIEQIFSDVVSSIKLQ